MVNKGETQQESRGGDGRREGTRGKIEKKQERIKKGVRGESEGETRKKRSRYEGRERA